MEQQYIDTIVAKGAGLLGKALTFDKKADPTVVGKGFDDAIAALTSAKEAYLANPTEAPLTTAEEMFDDGLQLTIAALDGEGQTTWGGYIQEADNLLQYVTNHPKIASFVSSLATMFKKKTVAATPVVS